MASQPDDARTVDRADTRGQADAYRLELDIEFLITVLGDRSLHFAVGFVTGALTIPEPLDFDDCVEELNTFGTDVDAAEDVDDESEELPIPLDVQRVLSAFFDSVQTRIADGAVASLVPIADDAVACDEWIDGFDLAVAQTLHELSPEESAICARVFARPDDRGLVPRAERKARARAALADDVARLIQLWRDVPPSDPEQDELRWSDVVPKSFVAPPVETVIHTPCPCGSGKPPKDCCG